MQKNACLPARCVKSNQPIEGRRLKRKLTWFHPLIYLSLAAGLLILVILVLVLQKKATIYIGLSQEWWHKRRRALWIGWLMGLGGLAVMIGSGVLLGKCPRGQEIGREWESCWASSCSSAASSTAARPREWLCP